MNNYKPSHGGTNTPNRNNNRGFQGRPEYKNQAYEFKDEFSQLDESLKQNDSSRLITIAKQIAIKLKDDVSKSQMRKFLDEIVSIKTEIRRGEIDLSVSNEKLDILVINKLSVLRPRFAYTVARIGKPAFKNFNSNIMDLWLERANKFTDLELEYFHLFIESLIAYHKVYAKNN